MSLLSVSLAFVRRDFLNWTSYRLAVLWQLLGVLTFIGLAYFIVTTLAEAPGLAGGQSQGALAFVLSGIAFTDLFSHGIHAVYQTISENQKAGTLEPMLMTPISATRLLFSSALFKLLLAVARLTVYLVMAVVLLGFWHGASVLSALLVVVPALATFIAIGTLSAAFVMVVKQGDPVVAAYAWLTALLGGVLFPVSALPAWVQPLAMLVPLTHALDGVRAALGGAQPAEVARQAGILAAMAAVLLPLGVVCFNAAVNRAKQEGSLAQY